VADEGEGEGDDEGDTEGDDDTEDEDEDDTEDDPEDDNEGDTETGTDWAGQFERPILFRGPLAGAVKGRRPSALGAPRAPAACVLILRIE
jgi:hypothetical protein